MVYSMKETCERTGFDYETLKFYCRQGLVPNVRRDERNHRIFDDRNIAWLTGLQCLRRCGMGIDDMRRYMQYCLQGENSIPEREAMLNNLKGKLLSRQTEIIECLDYIDDKQHYYRNVREGKAVYTSNLIDPDATITTRKC
jgi:DNA-binding transcriptional MerR regulator